MSRGIDEYEVIQSFLPESSALLFGILTQLADVWFLTVLLVALYVLEIPDRRDVAALGGLWLSSLGLYLSLKELFAFPRPDWRSLDPETLSWGFRQLYELTATASGYGFPSGHAVNATVVYVGLAYVLPIGTRRQRFLGAGAIVATVCFTRVALGVHYLVDVVAGVGVGLLLLGAAWVLARWEPVAHAADRATLAFGGAVVFAAFFVVASAASPEALALLAVTVATLAGWRFVGVGRVAR